MKILVTYRFIAITLAIITCSVSAQAQEFWGKTKYGMPSSAVRALFGNQLKSDPVEEPMASLSMTTSFCNVDFDVQFVFSYDKLLLVRLVGKSRESEPIPLPICTLDAYLSAFGKPTSAKENDSVIDYMFRSGDTVVNLNLWKPPALVIIHYSFKRSDL